MLKIISAFVDLIFPPSETQVMVRTLTKEQVGRHFSPERFKDFLYLTSYQAPIIQSLIKENKFHHNDKAAELLASLLEQWLIQRKETVILVPIPLSRTRQKERGYNQVTEVLKKLSPNPLWRIDESLLRRKKHTTPQTSLSRTERLKNMSDVFECLGTANDERTLVILLDDVVTTGATFSAAQLAMKKRLPSTIQIICVALAH